jgi:hypothetical protein
MARRKALAATLLVAIFLAIVWIVYHSFLRDDSRVTLPGHFGRLQCVAFSRDGKTIAAGNTKTEKQADDTVWNVGYVKPMERLWDRAAETAPCASGIGRTGASERSYPSQRLLHWDPGRNRSRFRRT